MKNKIQQQANKDLLDLLQTKMPFGKYKDRLICDLPEHYLIWFKQKGFPNGRLGQLLEMMCEIHIQGSEKILQDLKYRFKKTRYI